MPGKVPTRHLFTLAIISSTSKREISGLDQRKELTTHHSKIHSHNLQDRS
jgi:hypothetical protein